MCVSTQAWMHHTHTFIMRAYRVAVCCCLRWFCRLFNVSITLSISTSHMRMMRMYFTLKRAIERHREHTQERFTNTRREAQREFVRFVRITYFRSVSYWVRHSKCSDVNFIFRCLKIFYLFLLNKFQVFYHMKIADFYGKLVIFS